MIDDPTSQQGEPGFRSINPMGIPWVDPVDESRYVTGIALPVHAGATQK